MGTCLCSGSATILSSDWRICFSEFEELILVDFDSSNLIPEVKRTDRAAACFARLLSVCMYYPVVLCILRDRRSRAMFAAGYRASASRSLKGLGLTQHWTVRFGPLFSVVLVVFAAAAAFLAVTTPTSSARRPFSLKTSDLRCGRGCQPACRTPSESYRPLDCPGDRRA